MRKLFRSSFAAIFVYWLLCTKTAEATVNVTFSGPQATATQQEFIANTTGQYLSTLTASPFFPNTFTLTVKGKDPAYHPPAPPNPPPTTQDLLNTILRISTETYIYGWADGIDHGRDESMNRISNYIMNCSTPAYFGASTGSWNAGTCGTALMAAESDIYNLQFSTPQVLP